MTICSKMYEALDKRLDEKKNLDDIGSELCDAVDDPRGKAIRLIKQHKGEDYLINNSDWLGYQCHVIHEEAPKKLVTITDSNNSAHLKQSNQIDNFAPDEIVHESQPKEEVGDGDVCLYEPTPIKNIVKMCPCGCGYGYFEDKEKWYSPKQMENKYV